MKKVVGIILLTFLLSACGKDPCEDSVMAYVMSQKAVKQQLMSPSSAVFPTFSMSNNTFATPNRDKNNTNQCYFLFAGYVDSQNAFGAMLRKLYEGEIMYDKSTGKWTNTSLKFLN